MILNQVVLDTVLIGGGVFALGMVSAIASRKEHDKRKNGEVPEAVDPIEFLFEELLDLTNMVAPQEVDKVGHIRQELFAYRRRRDQARP